MHIQRLVIREMEGLSQEKGGNRMGYVPPSFGAPKEELPPPPPTFNEEELKNAEQEGFRRGFLEGENEGKAQEQSVQAQVDRELIGVVGQLVHSLDKLMKDYNRFVAEQKGMLPAVALAAARKVAGQALEENPLALIESLVHTAIDKMLGTPHIAIIVNDTLAPTLENRLIQHFAHNKEPGEISIVGDKEMAVSDCRIEWQHGTLERSTANIWQEVDQLIHNMAITNQNAHIATTLETLPEAEQPPSSPPPTDSPPETPTDHQ